MVCRPGKTKGNPGEKDGNESNRRRRVVAEVRGVAVGLPWGCRLVGTDFDGFAKRASSFRKAIRRARFEVC